MKSLGRWSVENRVPVNILMVLLIVGGVMSFNSIHREVFPLFALRYVTVTTRYYGVTPLELEQLVTIPIENAVAEVDDVAEVLSMTTEGLSVVIIEFEESLENITIAAQDVESAVDAIPNLPADIEDPIVAELKLEFPVIDVAVAGVAAEPVRREIAKSLKRRMERIDGVSSIVAQGLRDKEIWIELDPDRLYGLNLPLDLVLGRIRQHLVNVPAGSMRTQQGEVLLRTSGTTADVEQVESIVVRTAADGQQISVGDLGRVRATFEEATTLARANGLPAINLHLVKQVDGDTISIVDQVSEIIAEFEASAPEGVEFIMLNDGSAWIESRLRTMYQSGLWGLALVILVLNTFLSPRIAAMTAFGLPLAISGGLIVLYLSGGSLNMLSLFAFILVLGILVDDAIVIAENSYRYMQRGIEPVAATIRGTREVTLPVVGGVTTTIAAFLPLLLTSGVMGEFLAIIPVVAVACLVASLLEALVILPSHLADFSPSTVEAPEQRGTPRWFRQLRKRYGRAVVAAIRHRYATLGLVLLAAIAAGVLATSMRFIFFDETAAVEVLINVKTPASNAIEDTERVIQQVEDIALRFPPEDVESVIGLVGQWPFNTRRSEFGPNLGQVRVRLPESQVFGGRGPQIYQELRAQLMESVVGAESIELERESGGPPVGRPIYVQVLGEEIDVLQQIAAEIKGFLATVDGVHDISDSFMEGKDEIRVITDEDRTALYGLSVDSIGRAVRTAMDGTVIATVQEGDEDIDVRVRYLPEYRRNLDDVARLRISTTSGDLVPLGSIATLRRTRGYGRIDRESRERVISVSADVDTDVLTSVEANALVAEQFIDVSERYPGYFLDFAGEAEETDESMSSLFKAFVIALLVIYAILGAIFRSFAQPFVVLFAIPFSLIGVVTGFFIMGEALTFMSLFGVIALTGVVVNDSLLLVHFINEARVRGVSLVHAVAVSATRRFRPVMLTTLSTIAGVLPLSLVSTSQAAWLSPMAKAIVWGLSFSTILTLLLVPALYVINEDLRQLVGRLFGRSNAADARA